MPLLLPIHYILFNDFIRDSGITKADRRMSLSLPLRVRQSDAWLPPRASYTIELCRPAR